MKGKLKCRGTGGGRGQGRLYSSSFLVYKLLYFYTGMSNDIYLLKRIYAQIAIANRLNKILCLVVISLQKSIFLGLVISVYVSCVSNR